MARLNAYGNTLVTVDDTTGIGIYAADGSMRVTVVDGTTVTGLYAADGSINIVVVEATDTPVCRYHECGALRGVAVSEPTVGFVAPNGALYMAGLAVAWDPSELFATSVPGAWYDPSDLSTMSQDDAGTTPVTAAGQAVGRMLDKSGNGNHVTQATPTARPILRQDAGGKWYLEFDGVDDWLRFSFTSNQPVTRFTGMHIPSAVQDSQVLGGAFVNSSVLYFSSSSELAMFNGSVLSPLPVTIPGSYVVREVHNGASSSLRVNNGSPLTGDSGSTSGDGITLGGAFGVTPVSFSPIDLYGVVHVCRALTATESAQTEAWMNGKTGAY